MGKRSKDSNNRTWIVILIICFIVIVVTFFMLHDIQNKVKETENQNIVNQEETENTVVSNEIDLNEQNVIENISENIVNNTIENTQVANKVTNNVTNTTINNNTNNYQPGITDKKQKAISLVKREWGEDNSVDYVFDYVNEKGEYVIAVKDKSSAVVKYYFRVNLETETVELD